MHFISRSVLACVVVCLASTQTWAQADDLIKNLIQSLKDPDEKVRAGARGALSGLDMRAAPALLDAMQGNDDLVRAQAAHVFGYMGIQGRRHAVALPILKRMVKDKNDEVRIWSTYAISQIVLVPFLVPEKDLSSVLIDALQDPQEKVRIYAEAALGRLDKHALPDLFKVMEGDAPKLRAEAAKIVASMGTHGRRHGTALPALKNLLKDKDKEVRTWAAYAVCQIVVPPLVHGTEKDLVAPLMDLLQDPDEKVRSFSLAALTNLDTHALPALLEALESKDAKARADSARILGRMAVHGRRHAAAVAPLSKALRDEDVEVRRQAAEALRWLMP